MPIRTNLNEPPYYDDYDIKKQYHRILFRPGYALQARELTQLQSILQNQVEQFGDNIFKEGSIIKGCTFTELSALQYIKVTDTAVNNIDPTIPVTVNEFVREFDDITGVETFYEILGTSTQLRALITQASFGFETNDPDLSTFYINYLNTSATQAKTFDPGESLEIYKYTVDASNNISIGIKVATFTVTSRSNHAGNSYGIESAVGIVYQRGHFLYAKSQSIILSKYTNIADNVSVGYRVRESLITSLTDDTLYDNSIGTPNQNAPGANRLKLEPVLVAIPTPEADADPTFFALARYLNGNAVQVRDVSQYNVLGEEMSRRTYEESGNYTVKGFKTNIVNDANSNILASIGPGLAYVKGFRVESKADIIIPVDQLELNDTSVQTNQSIQYNYGSYVDITDKILMGTLPVGTYATADLKNVGGVTIGTAMVRNYTPDRVYISNIRMSANNFADVVSIDGATGSVKIVPVIKQTRNDSLVFDIGETFLKSVNDISTPVRKARVVENIADSFVMTALAGEDFNVDINIFNTLIVDATQGNLQILSIIKDSPTQITINLVPGQLPTLTGTVYYNSRIISAVPHSKLSKTLYVKSTYSPATSKYSLGFPDVYQVVSIIDSGNNNVTNSFRLRENQQDHYYDLSYIEYIPGRPAPTSGLMSITVKTFKLNASGSYFFTVNSYPADLDLSFIPSYKTTSGITLNLRDCLDFRPYAVNTVSYDSAEVVGTAPTVSTAVGASPTFSGTFLIPAINAAATLDYEFYLNRTDIIVIDSYGKFSAIRGKPARKSTPAPIPNDVFQVAEIYIPGYPAISALRASQENKPSLAVRSKPLGTKSYTMKDIEFIDKKLDKLLYYTSLSLLESSTQNLNITDENGLTRFKNGILIDPFDDLSIADVRSVEFNAGLDFTEKSLTPSVKTIPINLRYKSSTSISLHPSTSEIDVATLVTSTNIPIISQQYATSFRNCVSNFYNYMGRGSIHPEYDSAFDTVKTPDLNLDIDLATPFVEYTSALQELIPLTSTSSTIVQSNVSSLKTASGTQFYDTVSDTTRTLQLSRGNTNQQSVGDFVTNIYLNPYMRSKEIKVLMHGLRPDTKHYFFFDGVNVDSSVVPGIAPNSDSVRDVVPIGNTTTEVFSNAIGTVAAIFTIPDETFYVGDRVLTIVDVDDLHVVETASTSGGSLTYRAYNFSSNTQGLTVSTRTPKFTITDAATTRNVAGRFVSDPPAIKYTYSDGNFRPNGDGGGNATNWSGRNGEIYSSRDEAVRFGGGAASQTGSAITSSGSRSVQAGSAFGKTTEKAQVDSAPPRRPEAKPGYKGTDPLAQTFYIKSAMTADNDCLFASRVDIFFKRKSLTNGVTVMIREVENGYPAREILPFSETHLKSSSVLTSDDGSLATQFYFAAPIRLDAEKEYCVVIMPDGDDPDYLAFTSKVGLNDFASGTPVNMDWGDGVLFTSTNNRAWQSYQDEDLKFTLYRRDFTEPSGIVTLTNDDNEFLSVTNINGDFKNGEIAYTIKPISGSTGSTVSLITGSTQIAGTALSTTYAANDYIYVVSGLNKDLFKILQVTSTTMTVDKPAKFTGSFTGNPAVSGRISYYNNRNPIDMYLEASSASDSKVFGVSDIITGFTSGAFATVASVDNIELSYIQPFISRTNSRVTEISMLGVFTDPADTDVTYFREMAFNDKTTFNEKGCIINSKSNGSNTFEIELRLNNGSNSVVTPCIDVETASILAYQYKVGANAATSSTYVSKTIELAENLDAEDFVIYATAYRPVNTSVNIYFKVQNSSDPLPFELNEWIPLEIIDGAELYSSISNINDFREFVYKLPDTAKVGSVLTYTNESGVYSGYRRFAVKIELIVNEVNGRVPIGSVPRLLDYRGVAIT